MNEIGSFEVELSSNFDDETNVDPWNRPPPTQKDLQEALSFFEVALEDTPGQRDIDHMGSILPRRWSICSTRQYYSREDWTVVDILKDNFQRYWEYLLKFEFLQCACYKRMCYNTFKQYM